MEIKFNSLEEIKAYNWKSLFFAEESHRALYNFVAFSDAPDAERLAAWVWTIQHFYGATFRGDLERAVIEARSLLEEMEP